MMNYLFILIAIFLFAIGGCHSVPENTSYAIYYYTTYDLMDIGQGRLPRIGYTAICRIPIRDKTFWEQEFFYEDSSKNWELHEVRIHKIVDDTLLKVESFNRDPFPIYPIPRDPEELLLWGTDTVFTPVFFPMTMYAEYTRGKKIDIYDSAYTTIVQEKIVENMKTKLLVFDMMKKIRKKLGIQGLWSFGLEYPYAIRYVGMSDIQVGDTLYKSAYWYLLRSTDAEMFRQYQKLTKYFSRDYVLLQESMGWNEDGFVYRKLQKEKPKELPACRPLSLVLER